MASKAAFNSAFEKAVRPCSVELSRCDKFPLLGRAEASTKNKQLKAEKSLPTADKPKTAAVTLKVLTEKPLSAIKKALTATETSQAEKSQTVAKCPDADTQQDASEKSQNSEKRPRSSPAKVLAIIQKKEAMAAEAVEEPGPPTLKRQKRECVGKRAASIKKEKGEDDAAVSDKDDEDYGGGSYDNSDSDDSDAEWGGGGKKKRGSRGRIGGAAKRGRGSPKDIGKGAVIGAGITVTPGLDAKNVPASAASTTITTASTVMAPRPRGRPLLIYATGVGNGGATSATLSNGVPGGPPAHPVQPVVRQVSGGRGAGARSNCMELLSSEMTPELMAAVTLANNMNTRRDLDLQTLYVKIDDASDGMNALLGWAIKEENKLFFQCMFCPTIDTTAKGIAAHIRRAHHSLAFAMVKKVPPASQLLFMHCRRCDYITVDTTSVWIHFANHHGLRGILSRVGATDITPTPTTRRAVNAADVATVFPFYKCSLCEFLATDNRYVAQHAVQNHKAGDVATNFNGCFVKVVRLGKPKQPVEGETYADVAARSDGAASAGVQSDTFVCVLCSYVSFCHYLAMSHHMRVHTGKFLMYKCSYDQCKERCGTADSMIQHLKGVHECGTVLCQRMCCQITIVEKQGAALTESFSLP